MRAALAAATLLAACAAPEARRPGFDEVFHPEDFVVAGNACGARAYAHLIGEEFATAQQATMRADARVIRSNMANTLEYEPQRLNVILDGENRIAAIGCF